MMQGITTLPGAQQTPQQPQAPGQAAPFRAMPAAQPKTPASEIAPYEGMDLQRLVAAFQQRPSGPLLGLITKKAEAEKLQQQMAQQQAMGAYAQQGPQTVKDMALANAMQVMRPTQMARHGGVMHGYAGGGAVAFQYGGNPRIEQFKQQIEEYLQEKERLRAATASGDPRAAAMYAQKLQALRGSFEPGLLKAAAYASSEAEAPAYVERLLTSGLPAAQTAAAPATPVPAATKSMVAPDAAAMMQRQGPRWSPSSQPRANRPGTGAQRTGAPAPAPAAPTGVQALMAQLLGQATTPNPELARIGREAEKSAQDTAALLQRMQSLSPEEAAARAQYYKTIEGAYEPQRKALEAARASTREGLLQSPEALARLASAFGGAKRVGQGLSAAAGAAGEVLGERRKRAEQLEERYQTLSSQLAITTAQAKRADVEGDEKRKRDLMVQAQGLKDRLLATQMDLLKTGTEMRRGDISGLAGLLGAQAQMMQAGKPTAQEFLYNLYKRDPKAFEGFLTAQQGPKSEAAERTAMLRALVTEAVKNPLMFQQLPPEMQAIVRQEMAKLGVTSSLPSGANVRE